MPQRGRLILSHFHLSPLRTGMRGAEWIGDYDLRVTQDQAGATDAPEPAASEAHEVPRVGSTDEMFDQVDAVLLGGERTHAAGLAKHAAVYPSTGTRQKPITLRATISKTPAKTASME